MRRPRSLQRLGRSPTVRGCDRRCRARPRGSGGGRRLGSGGGPRRPAGRQGGRALALRPPFGPRRDSWRPVADVTSAAARAHCPRSEAVVIDIRGTSGAAAWLMVRLLVWSARAVAVSGSSCGDKFARANLCTSICCAPSRATAVWEGQALSRLPRPTDHDGGGDSDWASHRLQKAGPLLVENPLRNEPNRADARKTKQQCRPAFSQVSACYRKWERTTTDLLLDVKGSQVQILSARPM